MVTNLDREIERYKGIVDADPEDHEAHMKLGLAYSMKGQYDDAERELKEGVKLDPDSAESHFDLGMVLHMGDKLDEAIESI